MCPHAAGRREEHNQNRFKHPSSHPHSSVGLLLSVDLVQENVASKFNCRRTYFFRSLLGAIVRFRDVCGCDGHFNNLAGERLNKRVGIESDEPKGDVNTFGRLGRKVFHESGKIRLE